MGTGPIGRDAQRATVACFLREASAGPAALVLEGDPGIGKSILWRDAVSQADDGRLILSSTPSSSDTKLSFAVLGDLLAPALHVLPSLAEPRRRALEVALSLRAPSGRAPASTSVALATLDAIRLLAHDRSVLIAIDDAPWIDPSSLRVLRFVLRRLGDQRVGILVTARSSVDDAVPALLDGFTPLPARVRLPALDVRAIRALLSLRLGISLPRHLEARIHEQSGGNPFYALELTRSLERRHVGRHDPIPLPGSLRSLMAERLETLSPPALEVATYAALLSRPTVSVIAAPDDEGPPASAVDEAVDAGILHLHDDAITFDHPLLAAAVVAGTSEAERRRIHACLATIVTEPEERARHLAAATAIPDAAVATMLDIAVDDAASRGAPAAAASLAEDALRLTPVDRQQDVHRRMLTAIDQHRHAGDLRAALRIVERGLPSAPAGTARASLLVRLGGIREKEAGFAEAEVHLLAAAAETSADMGLRSAIQLELAFARMHLGDMGGAEMHAQASLAFAEMARDPRLIEDAAVRLASFRFVMGRGVDEAMLMTMFAIGPRMEPDPLGIEPMVDPSVMLGYILKSSDRFEEARTTLEARFRQAVAAGNDGVLPLIVAQISELAFWAGDWTEAERRAVTGLELIDAEHRSVAASVLHYCLALVYGGRGQVKDARRSGRRAKEAAERDRNVPLMLMAEASLAALDLAVGDAAATHRRLGGVSEQLASMGTGEPGVLRFMADEIEALVNLGEIDAALELTDYFEGQGRALDRPFALATGARCRALVEAASGDGQAAMATIDRALIEHERLPMPLELGRTLLVAGTIRRRAKQKRAAREALESASEIFTRLGARLWADHARSELERVVVHATSGTELTPTEARIAELVAAGRTSREVAEALFISIKTVDSNLTRIYRKIGVRSRTELARAFARRPS